MENVRVEFKLETEFVNDDGTVIKFDPEHVKLPAKKRDEDAGYDVFSAEEGIIPSKGFQAFHTGVRLAVPFGWYYEIKGRSGLGFKGVCPFIGTLDATYNGFIRILLFNLSDEDYQVNKGDRIAQVLFHRQYEMIPFLVNEFSEKYDKRGRAGFGSSGN
jgi:dUTP pyrophosphatase